LSRNSQASPDPYPKSWKNDAAKLKNPVLMDLKESIADKRTSPVQIPRRIS
jgi:hypothetical protein